MDKTLFPTDAEFVVVPEATTGERQYYGRSHWPLGPWHQEEFDKVLWVDPETGLDCQLLRGPIGSWNGYVGVPTEHAWYGRTREDLDVHGGLTYSGDSAFLVAKESRPGDLWWFGFDTAHSWDLVPGMLASSARMHAVDPELFTDHLTYDPATGTAGAERGHQSYKTVSYCKKEVESLARQLRDIHLAAVGQPV